ncbi:MAG: baseplate J/gp47 family protein [Methylotenera sp.]|nr:baseplate J/gp47 family protein [Methylotenera sp.]
MAWFRPTLESLIKRNQADIESSIDGVDAKVRRKNLNIIAKMVSALAHGLYGNLAYNVKQIFHDTADTENLRRHASLWLDVPLKEASYAVGPVVLLGTNGVLVEADTVLIRADGVEYSTDAEATISAGQAVVNVTALTPGQTSNAVAGTVLSLASPIAGINGSATVDAAALTGGADEESDISLSNRVGMRIKNPPHGGANHDYIAWALEVSGVTRAWVYPQELGGGTVTVRFVRDDDASLIPDAAEVLVVQNHIDDSRPTTADVSVVAPIASPLDFTLSVTPNTDAVKAAVISELTDLLRRESIPAGTIPANLIPKGVIPGKLLISHIREAISLAAGETNYNMTSPVADVEVTTGHMITLGNFTWL